MKPSKTYLNRYFAFIMLLQATVMAMISLPQLEPARRWAEQLLRLPEATLWLLLLGLLLLSSLASLTALRNRISAPLQHLMQQTRLGSSSFAFKNKSSITEEDYLKHFIEAQALKFDELEQEALSKQDEVRRISKISRVAPAQYEQLQRELAACQAEAQALSERVESEQRAKSRLASDLALTEKALKQSKQELDRHLYQERQPAPQMPENEVGANGSDPQLSQTLANISGCALRLANAWAETPMTKIRDGLQEIHEQAEAQLERLDAAAQE